MKKFLCYIGLHRWRCVREAPFYGWDYICEWCGAKSHDWSMW